MQDNHLHQDGLLYPAQVALCFLLFFINRKTGSSDKLKEYLVLTVLLSLSIHYFLAPS